ncbi:asparagine synthase-related protein [Haloarcula regularis]|uniref:asparagine synthase-related protein n=1 Tax=Haloarcula regularis TaxID=3033392 RepID=UPI0023E89E94|nr:asparagine synthase-related protein [Halomicroarcula sp. SYNS111]
MTGVAGGSTGSTPLDSLLEPMHEESWYEVDAVDFGDLGVALVHHGQRDPGGGLTWHDDHRAGVVYGAITNLDDLELSSEGLFEAVLSRPDETLAALDGPFLLVALDRDADRMVVGTDKLGTRQCFYTSDGPFAFGSNLATPLAAVSGPTIDAQGLSDMLLIGQVWGEKTLVEEISALPAASVLEYEGGIRDVRSYWQFEFETGPQDDPMAPIVEAYRQAVADTSATMDGSIGLWLSGGLDSRTLAGELCEHFDTITTYTYNANPSNGGNRRIARQISERLGARNEEVPLTPDRFVDVFDDAVTLTSGMLTWRTFLNLTAVFNIEDPADVVLEGCGQGTMLGGGLSQDVLSRYDTVEESLYQEKHQSSRRDVRRLLAADVDPMATYRSVVADSTAPDSVGKALDCYYRNYMARGEFASNPLARSQVGSRIPICTSGFLDAVSKLPLEYRGDTIPFTGGTIPAGTSRGKLELARRLDYGLNGIPYERTKMPPSRPLWLHVVGFVVNTATKRLLGKNAYGGRRLQQVWYEDHDEMRAMIDGLLDDACEREVFDADAIEALRTAHWNGEANNLGPLAALSTVERWFQLHLDKFDRQRNARQTHCQRRHGRVTGRSTPILSKS